MNVWTAARLAIAILLAATGEALSIYIVKATLGLTLLNLSQLLSNMITLAALPLALAIISAALVALTGTPLSGLAIALAPLAANWDGPVSLAEALLTFLLAAGAAVLAGIARGLLKRGSGQARPRLVPEGRRAPRPAPLSAAALLLVIQALARVPWIPEGLWPQLIYVMSSVVAAALASLSPRRIDIAEGAISSLGPLGLTVLLSINSLLGFESSSLLNSGQGPDTGSLEPREEPHGLRPGA